MTALLVAAGVAPDAKILLGPDRMAVAAVAGEGAVGVALYEAARVVQSDVGRADDCVGRNGLVDGECPPWTEAPQKSDLA